MYYTKESEAQFTGNGSGGSAGFLNFDGNNVSWKVENGAIPLSAELAVQRYNSGDNYTRAKIIGDKISVLLVPASVFGIVRLISETAPKAKDDNSLTGILLDKAHNRAHNN